MNERETIEDLIAEMRFHGQQNIDAEKDKPEYGILTVEGRIAQSYADRLDAAHKREIDVLKQRCAELNARPRPSTSKNLSARMTTSATATTATNQLYSN